MPRKNIHLKFQEWADQCMEDCTLVPESWAFDVYDRWQSRFTSTRRTECYSPERLDRDQRSSRKAKQYLLGEAGHIPTRIE